MAGEEQLTEALNAAVRVLENIAADHAGGGQCDASCARIMKTGAACALVEVRRAIHPERGMGVHDGGPEGSK